MPLDSSGWGSEPQRDPILEKMRRATVVAYNNLLVGMRFQRTPAIVCGALGLWIDARPSVMDISQLCARGAHKSGVRICTDRVLEAQKVAGPHAGGESLMRARHALIFGQIIPVSVDSTRVVCALSCHDESVQYLLAGLLATLNLVGEPVATLDAYTEDTNHFWSALKVRLMFSGLL